MSFNKNEIEARLRQLLPNIRLRPETWSELLLCTALVGVGFEADQLLPAKRSTEVENELLTSLGQLSESLEDEGIRLSFAIDELDGQTLHALSDSIRFIRSIAQKDLSSLLQVVVNEIAEANTLVSSNFYTPFEVAKLMVEALRWEGVKSLYDPASGSGGMLMAAAAHGHTILQEVVDTPSHNTVAHLLRRLMELIYPNIAQRRFDEKAEGTKQFDAVLMNPPFGVKVKHFNWDTNKQFRYDETMSESWFIRHALDHLTEKGRAAVIVPQSFLASQNSEALRQELVESDCIEGVVSLPPKIFYHTGVATAVLFLDKGRKNSDIFFANITEAESRGRSKGRMGLIDIQVTEVMQHIDAFRIKKGEQEVPATNWLVLSKNDLMEADCVLQFSRLAFTGIKGVEHLPPSEELLAECKAIEKRLLTLQKQFE